MKRVRIAAQGPNPGGYCPSCGVRLGNAFGPSADGHYIVGLSRDWHPDDLRVWRKSRHHSPAHPRGVLKIGQTPQSIDTIICKCGEELLPPS